MKVLMLRGWDFLTYAATFKTLETSGVGATEFQLLQHARALQKLGHEVRILGVTREDCIQEGIQFLGADGQENSLLRIREDCGDTDVVFTNATRDLGRLRAALPAATIIEVCQNGPHFENDQHIDLYAFVSAAQFAYYAVRYRKRRSKFVLLLSVPPWKAVYSKIEPVTELDQVVWLGSLQKQGLRRWAKAMSLLMKEHASLRWVLCVPSYDVVVSVDLPDVFFGIDLPADRVEFKNLSFRELAQEIRRSKLLVASLGGEDGPMSYLDGHAAGVPVLCGDDIYGKVSNPEGTGLRCSTTTDCLRALEFLIANPDVRKQMGEMGRKWIAQNLTEDQQYATIEQIMAYVALRRTHALPIKSGAQSDAKFSCSYWLERLEIKISNLIPRMERSGRA